MHFTAPSVEQLLVSATTPSAPLQNVTFEGIEFAYATWLQPSGNEGFAEMQANLAMTTSNTQGLCTNISPAGSCPFAAWTQPLAAVEFTGTKSVTIFRDKFDHLGGAGLALNHGASTDTVQGNEFADISSSGIQLGSADDAQPPASYATNVVVSQNATQSSTGYGAPASRAADGNTDGDFVHGSVSHTNAEATPWWQDDLGSSQFLNSVNVYNRTDCCANRLANYYLFVSDKPFNTALTPAQQAATAGVWSSYQSTQAGAPTSIPVNTSGRYVMVQLANTPGTTSYLSLAEVQVMSADAEIATGNKINDNYIHDIGVEYTAAVGINVAYSRNTTISHNQLDHLPYSGINVGWGGWHTNANTPNVNPNINADNTISDNLIYDVMQTRGDGGAIYTNGPQGTSIAHGTTISGNVTFGNLWESYTANAYYTDAGSAYVSINGNVQYKDPNHFVGGCSAVGHLDIENNYYVGDQSYGCTAPVDETFTANHPIAQNPAPGAIPTSVFQNVGLELDYVNLTTTSAPSVALASPTSAGQVLISGTGFTSTATVAVAGIAASSVTYLSSNYLIATIPSSVHSGDVTVTTAAGTSSITSADFTFDLKADLANGKAATQSSDLTGSTLAGLAADGNTDGDYNDGSVSHTNYDTIPWWQVDLGSSVHISTLDIYNRTDCCASRLSDYWVFVSASPLDKALPPDKLAAASLWSTHQIAEPNNPTTLQLPANTSGEYLTVRLTNPGYLALAEVLAFGS